MWRIIPFDLISRLSSILLELKLRHKRYTLIVNFFNINKSEFE